MGQSGIGVVIATIAVVSTVQAHPKRKQPYTNKEVLQLSRMFAPPPQYEQFKIIEREEGTHKREKTDLEVALEIQSMIGE